MKKCSTCEQTKRLEYFYTRKTRKSGYTSECKQCFKVRMGSRHQRHKEQLVLEFGSQCQRCGYDTCTRILHFHHIDPGSKTFEIADRLSSSLNSLRKEASKCMLLCPNCHMEKHQGVW